MSREEIIALYDNLGDLEDATRFNRSVSYKNTQSLKEHKATYGTDEGWLPWKPDIYDITAFRVLEVYDEKFPAAKKLMNNVGQVAKNRGHIRTILNRRRRFGKGESTHKALNALLQGSAADIMKKAMLDVWQSGVCDVLGAPLLTVHDELNFSVPNTREGIEAVQEAHRLMENVYKLNVPITCDCEKGPDWGHVE